MTSQGSCWFVLNKTAHLLRKKEWQLQICQVYVRGNQFLDEKTKLLVLSIQFLVMHFVTIIIIIAIILFLFSLWLLLLLSYDAR